MSSDLSRIDLHVHSRYSRNAGEWWLNKVGARECYSEPMAIYRSALKRGMDFVTLTDHDTIDGALQLAGQPNFFISEEVTTKIPESGAKLHVIALDINEKIHQDLQYYRGDVYELVSYMRQEQIMHFVAHPFFRMGSTLNIDDLEKILLLFNIIEVQNGGKQLFPSDLLVRIIRSLTLEVMWEMAERQNLLPYGRAPWRKTMVAGSDDHGGILIGHPHTVMPKVYTINDLLQGLRIQKCWPSHESGQALSVAHHIYAVAFNYIREMRQERGSRISRLLFKYGDMFFGLAGRSPVRTVLVQAAVWSIKKWPFQGTSKTTSSTGFVLFREAFLHLLRTDKEWQHVLMRGIEFDAVENVRFFGMINRLVNTVLHRSLKQGRLINANLPAYVALAGIAAPYLIAFRNERRDRPLMQQARKRFLGFSSQSSEHRTAVFIDTEIRDEFSKKRLLQKAAKWGMAYPATTLFTFSGLNRNISSEQLHAYKPAAHASMGVEKELALPPVLEIAQALFDGEYERIHVRTFGPMGILGILFGQIFSIPVSLTYPYQILKRIQKQSVDHHRDQVMFSIINIVNSLVHEFFVTNDAAFQQAVAMGINKTKIHKVSRSNKQMLELIKEMMSNVDGIDPSQSGLV